MARILASVAFASCMIGGTAQTDKPYGVNSVTYASGTSPPGKSTSKYTLLLNAGHTNINSALEDVYPEAWVQNDGALAGPTNIGAGQRNCMISTKMPSKPRSLSFCHKFNDKACCVPQLDDENNEFFGQLTALGLSCRIRGDIREDPLAKLYCLNCDPQQPQYLRPTMSIDSSTNLPNMAVTTYSDGDPANNGALNQVLISSSWASSEFGTDPLLNGPSDRFAKCGLLVSSPCQGDAGTLDNRDRYTCGDDLFIPPDAFKVINSTDGTVSVLESFEKMLNTPDLGTPQIDGLYYFKLVEDRECSDAEAQESAGPNCLRSATQMTNLGITGLTTHGAVTTYQDLVCNHDCSTVTCTTDILGRTTATGTQENEMCCCYPMYDELAFNSASMASPSLLLSVLMACIASLVLA
mmetsp:Transcript_73504/g.102113  ORF Transcript_73504/g.102113 Transcript_73504/m.102113 type:complete len:409 (+) Transcript_73504:135-1361(+)